jgi:hypothetical protein
MPDPYVKPASSKVYKFVKDHVVGSRFVKGTRLVVEETNDINAIASTYPIGLFTSSICLHKGLTEAIETDRNTIVDDQEFAKQTEGMSTEQQFNILRDTVSVQEAKALGRHELGHILHEDVNKGIRDQMLTKFGFISREDCAARGRDRENKADIFALTGVTAKGRKRISVSPKTRTGFTTFFAKVCVVDERRNRKPDPYDTHPYSCDRAERGRAIQQMMGDNDQARRRHSSEG